MDRDGALMAGFQYELVMYIIVHPRKTWIHDSNIFQPESPCLLSLMSSICALHIVLSIKRLKILRPDKDLFSQTALEISSEDMRIEIFDV